MNNVHASSKSVKGSIKKLSLFVSLIKKKNAIIAVKELTLSKKTTSLPIKKILLSAISNANNKGFNIRSLIVDNVIINKSFVLKRGMARARGRYGRILKHYSSVTIYLKVNE